MSTDSPPTSRRDFVARAGLVASAAAIGGCAPRHAPDPLVHVAPTPAAGESSGRWNLSWVDRLKSATDRAVFDWPQMADPSDPIVLQIAERWLDGCASAYAPGSYEARAVLNVRTRAVPAALVDEAWTKWSLGAEYDVKDPTTGMAARRNPFWRHVALATPPGTSAASGASDAPPLPTVEGLMQRGAVVLVCDFALGHLARRLATKSKREADAVHRELLDAIVPGAYVVPSGIFGLAKAQNAGCAYLRV